MDKKFNFKVKTIQELPSAPADSKSPDHYIDTQTEGLWLRVTKTGVKTFIVKRWACIDGKSGAVTVQLGRFSPTNKSRQDSEFLSNPLCVISSNPLLTVEDARIVARAVVAKLGQGINPADQKRRSKEELTLSDLFREYIERHAKKTRKTWEVMEKDFARDLSAWHKRAASLITNHDVERLHGTIATERGHYRANRTIQLLRAIYNKAIEWKLHFGDNPARGITLFEEKPRERFLSDDEIKALFAALSEIEAEYIEKQQDPLVVDFIKICLLTGARKSNVRAMKWDEIHWDKGTWEIVETKNGSSQTIALTGMEIAILHKRQERNEAAAAGDQSEFVFPGPGKTGHLIDPKKVWDRIRKKAKIMDITVHDLRRNLGSWMASQNVNVALIKSALNHKDMKTTLAVYARTAKAAEREGREVAHNAMLQAAGLLPDSNNVMSIQKSREQAT